MGHMGEPHQGESVPDGLLWTHQRAAGGLWAQKSGLEIRDMNSPSSGRKTFTNRRHMCV